MTGVRGYRRLALAEWEVCALLAGAMTQKRVPASLFAVPPRVGALIWVQEPFIEYQGKGADKMFSAIGYRADAGPAGGFPKLESIGHRQVQPHIHVAAEMYCGISRLTLEVTGVRNREASFWEVSERAREGLPWLIKATNASDWARTMEHFHAGFRRSYGVGDESTPLLILQFKLHRAHVSEVAAASARENA